MSNNNEFRKYAVKHLGMSSNGVDQYMKYNGEIVGLTPNIIEERPMNIAAIVDDGSYYLLRHWN